MMAEDFGHEDCIICEVAREAEQRKRGMMDSVSNKIFENYTASIENVRRLRYDIADVRFELASVQRDAINREAVITLWPEITQGRNEAERRATLALALSQDDQHHHQTAVIADLRRRVAQLEAEEFAEHEHCRLYRAMLSQPLLNMSNEALT